MLLIDSARLHLVDLTMADFHHDLQNFLGFMFAGTIISAMLVGFLLCQGCSYFKQFPKDRMYIKVMVSVALVCEVVHQALISWTLYHFAVDQPVTLSRFIWGQLLPCIPNSVAIVAVQSFFILRIYNFSKKTRLLAVALIIMVVLEFCLGMVILAKTLHSKTFTEFDSNRRWMMSPIALAVLVDVIIAIALVTALHRSRTGIQRTDTLINSLIVFTLSTGLLTAIWAVGTIIPIAVTGMGLISMFFYCLLGAVYVISFLFSLNVRQSLQATFTEASLSFATKSPTPMIRLSVVNNDTSSEMVDQKADMC